MFLSAMFYCSHCWTSVGRHV